MKDAGSFRSRRTKNHTSKAGTITSSARKQKKELRQQFSNGAHGLALILYPGCPLGVLDHDGTHAKEAWQTTGIELPETARNISRSGYDHLFFRMPANTPARLKRGIRLVEASCDCKDNEGKPKPCGVDFLVNGYVVYAADARLP